GTREHCGSTDVAVIRTHRQLLRAAKALAAADGDAAAAGLPALGGSGDFQAIRGAEKIPGARAELRASSAPTPTPRCRRPLAARTDPVVRDIPVMITRASEDATSDIGLKIRNLR